MRIRRTFTALLGGALLAGALAVPAAATEPSFGNGAAAPGSVYAVLAADDGFDFNGRDYDILEAAAEAVINTKGAANTTVAALNNPDAELTVFAPNDNAFRWLVFSLTGRWYWSEATVLDKLVGAVSGLVGPAATIDTIEAVLLYHVVGGKVLSSAVPGLDGVDVPTVGGGTFKINVGRWFVSLIDKDPDALNPTLVRGGLDIETGNGKSVIHTISLVLRPIDLPRGF
ncbi:MAG TPA: fasciclin domain-containing protein [Candidatus Nanopelagicales bacterium]|nr:fasciclin domain-containing protein [Candidatus Nanopelagicales bacterium]